MLPQVGTGDGAEAVSTVRGMPTPTPDPQWPRRLDTRHLQPRDYLADPSAFGSARRVEFVLPQGGDPRSLLAAQVQHDVARALRADPDPKRAGRVTTQFHFSRSAWSACLSGKRWMGATVFAAALTELRADLRR